MTPKPDIPALATWQEIDRRLNAGERDIEETIDAAFESGLVRRVLGLNLLLGQRGLRLGAEP